MERRFRKLVFEPMDLIRMALEIPGMAYECTQGLQPGMQFVETVPRLEEEGRYITFLLYCPDWPVISRGELIPQLELVFRQHHNIVVEELPEEIKPRSPLDDFIVRSA